MPPEMRAGINPLDLVKVETYEKQRRDSVPSDRTAYNELADLAVLRPQSFLAPGFLENNRDKLEDNDYQRLVDARRALRAGQESEFVKTRQLQEEITRTAMVQLGYAQRPERVSDPLTPKKEKEDEINDFREALAQRVDFFTKAEGKIPNPAEVQTMADELLVKSAVQSPTWYGGTSTENVALFDQYPISPRNASERVAATVYLTPKGPLQWTGRAWRELPRE